MKSPHIPPRSSAFGNPLERARLVLGGAYAGVSRKMLWILFMQGEFDMVIDEEGMAVMHARRPRWVRYGARHAPGVLSQLLRWADAAATPTNRWLRIPGGSVSRNRGASWRLSDKLVYVRDEESAVRVLMREAMGLEVTDETLPEDLPLPMPERLFEVLGERLLCPHCGTGSDRFRKLGDGSLVCPSCARSFKAGNADQ